MKYKGITIAALGVSMLLCLSFVSMAADESKPIIHEEFGGLLFDHLELGKTGITITQLEKLQALSEYKLEPAAGWKPGQPLHMGEMAVVIVRVYAIENKLNPGYPEKEAIQLLVNEKILDKEEAPETEVNYQYGIEIITKIPRGPETVPKTILLPRIPVEPPASPAE